MQAKNRWTRELPRLMRDSTTRDGSPVTFDTPFSPSQGVWFNVPEDNIYTFRVCIEPVEDPYRHQFCFEFTIPQDYPNKPPAVRFDTGSLTESGSKVRFNPNMYQDGKVCLSILNTWEGDPWTPACSVSQVAVVLQTRMSENPLQYEPSYENTSKTSARWKQHQAYDEQLSYETMRLYTKPLPTGYECFEPLRKEYFMAHAQQYIDELQALAIAEPVPRTVVLNVYSGFNFTSVPNYKQLCDELTTLRNSLMPAAVAAPAPPAPAAAPAPAPVAAPVPAPAPAPTSDITPEELDKLNLWSTVFGNKQSFAEDLCQQHNDLTPADAHELMEKHYVREGTIARYKKGANAAAVRKTLRTKRRRDPPDDLLRVEDWCQLAHQERAKWTPFKNAIYKSNKPVKKLKSGK